MAGAGNDFIMIDNRKSFFPAVNSKIISGFCERRTGVGADGIILIEHSDRNDFRMRILNSDGTEAEMCGNGARCAVKFAKLMGIIENSCTVETLAGELKGWVEGVNVRINMGIPRDYKHSFYLNLDDKKIETFFLNTGVPHAVIFVPDVAQVDVRTMGRWVRNHETFNPRGTNCNFVEITGANTIKIRTYERGVEDETFSCGTGTCASAIAAVLGKGLKWPVIATTLHQDTLMVDSKIAPGDEYQEFFLSGPVDVIFSGEMDFPKAN